MELIKYTKRGIIIDNQQTMSSRIAIGFMLFALFFGAGNLIFPAQLGQYAGTNIWPAAIGFLITGVGLPLIGILAMGFSGSKNLQELASRVHPAYGIFFTALLYLTIGPFFAAPRTGTVAYEVGIAPFVAESSGQLGLFIFTIIFFTITLLFSLYPANLVDNIGKILAPALVGLLVVFLFVAFLNPMGAIQAPEEAYASGAFITGFLEGYNTMDALASLVFGIIIITAIRSRGVTTKGRIFVETAKSGTIAIVLLGIIYVGIAYLGATSTSLLGIFDTGGPVLSGAANHYFGTIGNVMLAIVIILACLTTAIGLVTANAEYFHTLFPSISYKILVVFFSTLTFIIANFGLANIITFSIPVLMFLYPLAIVLMLITFVSPLFDHAQIVYIATIGVTFIISLFDGIHALYDSLGIELSSWMIPVLSFYQKFLPLYNEGLGWLLPALGAVVITGTIARFQKGDIVQKT